MNKRLRKIVTSGVIAAFAGLGAISFSATGASAATSTFAAVDSGGVLNANHVSAWVGEKLQIQGKVYTVIGVNTNFASGATSIRVNPMLAGGLNGKSLSVTRVN